MDNNPILQNDSMTSVVSPIAVILDAFLDHVETWDEKLAYVYDENLSYETGMAKWRQDNQIDSNNVNELPMFMFRRSVLRWEDEKGIGQRSRQFSVVDGGGGKKYKVIFGAFDIDFLYITRSMLDLERFEITYLMQSGISQKKTLSVDFGDSLPGREYNLEYQALDEKTINIENSSYKVLSGTFIMRGLFYAFDSDVKIIKNINAALYSYNGVCPPVAQETLGKIKVTEDKIILE